MTAPGPRQVDENNTDDERSLDALTKGDEEGRKHEISS
jgi:hypothetical protein